MITQNVRSLSSLEARFLTTLSSQGKEIFDTGEARQALGRSEQHIWEFLRNLVEKGWLRRIEKGKYLIIPLEAGPDRSWTEEASIIASYLVKPYAVAYWSALVHHNYTEQIPATIFIATTKRRIPNEAVILNIPFKFITLRPHKFFGLLKRNIGDREVVFTDREKTLIDCLDHPDYCGGISEVAKALSRSIPDQDISLEKLTAYAGKMRNRTIFKRLGYLSEVLQLPVGRYPQSWDRKISKGYSILDPSQPPSGTYNYRWLLRINVSRDTLAEEIS